jgi:hypothetical protein
MPIPNQQCTLFSNMRPLCWLAGTGTMVGLDANGGACYRDCACCVMRYTLNQQVVGIICSKAQNDEDG